MRLINIEEAKCAPVSLDEARSHLAIDATTRSEDSLIQLLIDSASADAENRTGRIWVESLWEWSEDNGFAVGNEYQFPAVPVTKVAIYDLDEVIPDVEEGETPIGPTDLSASLVKCKFPSLQPQGSPLVGSLLPIKEFPVNHKVVITAGYPVEETITPIEQKDSPILVVGNVTYSDTNKIHLVFNRSVEGEATVDNFAVIEAIDTEFVKTTPLELLFEKGGISLVMEADYLTEGKVLSVEFVGGILYDEFDNFVDVFTEAIPIVTITTEDDFILPEPVPVDVEYSSNAPARIKEWILTRTNTLYSQRSEIALRAGKSNDALFDERFVDVLLNAFKVEFV